MTTLILHGIGGYAGIHWQRWLHDQLVNRGYRVIMPNLPKPNHPDRDEWLEAVKEAIKSADLKDLIVVGHSLGVVTALDLIEQAKSPVKALISVSGFGEDYGAELNSYFLKKREINFNEVGRRLKNTFVLYSDNDPYVPQEILKSLADKLGVKPIIIPNGGHLNTEAGYTAFPKLLKIVGEIK